MFCPNPECPDFIDEGVHGEYVDTFSTCPKCGAVLVPELPTKMPRPRPSLPVDEEIPADFVPAIGPLVAIVAFDYPDEAKSTIDYLSAHGITVFEFLDDGRDFADKGDIATCTRLLVSQEDFQRVENLLARANLGD